MKTIAFLISVLTSVYGYANIEIIPDEETVEGNVKIEYSPFEDRESKVFLDNSILLSSENTGMFLWQAQSLGKHTLTYSSGTNSMSLVVNVTNLVFQVNPSPNPP
ncbi:MAG TPA: hypothetical protein O0X14_03385, partial [Methanocorpusculum sp.]|nr:hypothetical protein [Methanocorpusculum sp.]